MVPLPDDYFPMPSPVVGLVETAKWPTEAKKPITLKACGDWIIVIPQDEWLHPKGWYLPNYKYRNYSVGTILTSKQRDLKPGDVIFYRFFDAQDFTFNGVKLHAFKIESVIVKVE